MPNSEHPSDYASAAGTRDSPSLFAVLRRRAWIIVAVALLTGATAGAYAYLNRDTYESTAKLLFTQNVGPELNSLQFQYPAPDADNLAANNIADRGLAAGGGGHGARSAAARSRHLRRRRASAT